MDRRSFLGASMLTTGAAIIDAAEAAPLPTPTCATVPTKASRVPSPSDAAPTVVDAIISAALNLRFTDLDAPTVRRAKHRVLDLFGCAIGGKRGENARALIELAATTGGIPEATVLGTTTQIPAREAALVNAVVARMFDFEVMTAVVEGLEVASHHTPTTVMTALAMAEKEKSNGQAFLTGMIVGDDFAARTLAAAGLDFNDGWDGVPLHATMAAALIAARMRGLNATATRTALGLAADQISGTVQSIWDGGSSWKIQQGTAARNGIYAVELANTGISGMADPLMAPFGLYGQFTPGVARPELLTTKLGTVWHAEEYFKPYPSCAANHPTIECALALRSRAAFDLTAIYGVRLIVPAGTARLFVGKPLQQGPSLHSQHNFSVRFACANALLRGSFRQEHYDPATLAEPSLAAMLAKVELVAAKAGVRGVRIEVTMADGRILVEELTDQPRHYPRSGGSTEAEIVAKFYQQVDFAGNVPPRVADEILARVMDLEHEQDMSDFTRLLSRAVA